MSTDASWVGGMPEAYDTLLGPVKFTPYAKALVTRLEGSLDVLELAAGTGLLTRELVDAGHRVTATDLNPPMVAWGQAHVPEASWSEVDALDVPFDDASFDAVVCGFGVMFFPDRVQAYREVRRVLRPGGSFVLSVWDTVDQVPFTADLYEELQARYPGNAPDFFVRVPYGYAEPARIEADLREAGFGSVKVERVALTSPAPSAASYCDGYCLGTPLRFALAEREDLETARQALAARMTERWGEGPIEQSMSALVVTCS